jgi:hypothetical protein
LRNTADELQAAVRELMNQLMNISHDYEISNIEIAEIDEVDRCEHGIGNGPDLEPFRPFFGKNFLAKNWHGMLREKFIDRLQSRYQKIFKSDQVELLQELFDDRIQRLRREWNRQKKLTDEQFEAANVKTAKLNRVSSRRNWVTVFDLVMICS